MRERYKQLDIEVDGGVGPSNIHSCAEVSYQTRISFKKDWSDEKSVKCGKWLFKINRQFCHVFQVRLGLAPYLQEVSAFGRF